MLAIAKKLVSYSRQALESLSAVSAIARYDLTDAAAKVRLVAEELQARGEEDLVCRLDEAFASLHEQSAILQAEKAYSQRILVRLEEDLIEAGVPIDQAHEISIAYTSVVGIRHALQHDGSVYSRVQADPEVARLYDEAIETLHALEVRIDPWLDTGDTSPALDHYVNELFSALGEVEDNPPAEWETELELEQDGLQVMSLEEFYSSWGDDDWEPYYMPTSGEEDLGVMLSSRVMSIGDALRDLDNDFPVDLEPQVEELLDEIYAAYGELEELVVG